MELDAAQRRFLRGIGHGLRPQVQVGAAGVTPAVVAELDVQLEAHELVKVRVPGNDRDRRAADIAALADAAGATLVTRVGHTALLYRARADRPGIALPGGDSGRQT